MRSSTILDELRALGDPAGREGMARFGINAERALGIRAFRELTSQQVRARLSKRRAL